MATEPLEKQLPETTAKDEVQIFDTSEAVNKRDHISGRVDMGKSPMRMNCAFEQEADTIIAKLPERLVRWYKIDSLSETDYKLIREPDGTRVRLDLGPLIKREGV